jgi:anti-sigma B factor antagonist
VEIVEQRHGAVTVIRPGGPLLEGDVAKLRQRMADVTSRSLGRFVVDVAAVAYVDSPGLEVLVQAAQEMSQSGRALRLCHASETLREVLEIVGVSDLFEHYADVNSAVRSFL